MHLCHEEIFALASIIPALKYFIPWAREKIKVWGKA